MPLSRRSFLAALAALPAAGCGYQLGGTNDRSLYRRDIQTVAVPVFGNRTFRRGLEAELTKAIILQIDRRSPYKVVPIDRADTILEGEITDANLTTLSPDAYTGLPQEQSYNVTISFTWKNLRTGAILAQRKQFDQHDSFYPNLGEDQSVGATSSLEHLALGVVETMQADW